MVRLGAMASRPLRAVAHPSGSTVRKASVSRRFPHSRFRGCGVLDGNPRPGTHGRGGPKGRSRHHLHTPYMRVFRARDRAAVRRGLLTRWGRGVYLVGPLTDDLTEARAAVAAVPHGTLGFAVAAQLAKFGADRGAAAGRDRAAGPPREPRRACASTGSSWAGRDVTRMQGPAPAPPPRSRIVHLARTLPPSPTSAPSKRPSPSASRTPGASSRPSTATEAAAARPARDACSSSASTTCAPGRSDRCGAGSAAGLPTQPLQCRSRPVEGRRPLAGPPPRRRDQRPRGPQLTLGARPRPPQGAVPPRPGPRDPPLHRAAGDRRARARDRRHRGGAGDSEAVALRAVRARGAHAAALGVAEAAAVAERALPVPRELHGRGRLEAALADLARLGAGERPRPSSRSSGRGRTSCGPSSERSAPCAGTG